MIINNFFLLKSNYKNFYFIRLNQKIFNYFFEILFKIKNFFFQ